MPRQYVWLLLLFILFTYCLSFQHSGFNHPDRFCSRLFARSKKLAIDKNDEDVQYIPLEALRDLWAKSGKPLKSFNENEALMEYIAHEDDSDEDDDFSSIMMGTNEKNIPTETEVWLPQITASTPQIKSKSKLPFKLKPSKMNRIAPSSMRSRQPDVESALNPGLQGRSIGIDLGTTYSSVSIIEGGNPVIIPLNGARIVRSVVGYLPDGSTLVGEPARRQMAVNPQNTFASIKRVIGRTLKQVKDTNDKLSVLKVDPRADSPASVLAQIVSPLRGRIAPEEISAQVLRALLTCAEEYTKEKITRAVITVPAYFLPSQCEATERAGKLAGLDKVRLLREPEAAALAYGLTQEERQIVLVFDLGGGTFDVSVLEVGGGFVEVIATSGDAHLGGDDFDELIVGFMLEELRLSAGLKAEEMRTLQKDSFLISRLYEAAETAKIDLSSAKEAHIDIPLIYKAHSLKATLSRKRFDSMIKPLLTRLLKPLREVAIMSGINLPGESGQLGINEGAFADDDDTEDVGSDISTLNLTSAQLKLSQLKGKAEAKAKKKVKGSTTRELRRLQKDMGDPSLTIFPGGQQVDDVVMVGGSTRIPAVQKLVRVVTGIEPRRSVNPDEAVSLGAALMGGILDGTVTNMNVVSAWQAAMYRVFYEEQQKGGAGLGGGATLASAPPKARTPAKKKPVEAAVDSVQDDEFFDFDDDSDVFGAAAAAAARENSNDKQQSVPPNQTRPSPRSTPRLLERLRREK